MQRIQVIDSHTGGEPTRMVISGFPDTGKAHITDCLEVLRTQHDAWRKSVILEPRGHAALVGALLLPPETPEAVAGIIFFNNAGYLGMCGHGLIGVITSLQYMGRINPGMHIIETPVGRVSAILHEDGSVSLQNVPAYRYQQNQSVTVPGIGSVTGDIAWGGNWFFLIQDHDKILESENIESLTDYTWAIRQALGKAGITGKHGAEIDHIELFADQPGHVHRNFVLCPGKEYDRSPCGTGTSAKVACLAADGKLAEGETWTQTSILGSTFDASYIRKNGQIIPTVRGRAYISGENTLIVDKNDPFAHGIP